MAKTQLNANLVILLQKHSRLQSIRLGLRITKKGEEMKRNYLEQKELHENLRKIYKSGNRREVLNKIRLLKVRDLDLLILLSARLESLVTESLATPGNNAIFYNAFFAAFSLLSAFLIFTFEAFSSSGYNSGEYWNYYFSVFKFFLIPIGVLIVLSTTNIFFTDRINQQLLVLVKQVISETRYHK